MSFYFTVYFIFSIYLFPLARPSFPPQIRSCRGRAPEGSQAFTLLLLVSCVFLYSAILPYSFEASSLTCALRPFVTSLTYAIVYSIMLARSLMLATADSEG